jgi:epoxyqueuosine reductase QueG
MVKEETTLVEDLRRQAEAMGATFFGVADLSPARGFITAQGGDFLTQFPRALSIGVPLADGVVDELYQHLNGDIARTYEHHIYTATARVLDWIARNLATALEREGHKALPVPQGRPYDEVRLRGLISHKLVAHLAGLGWIGKNCLLITRDYGPRVRWVTVLTDAPLPPTGSLPPIVDHCKACRLCVDYCPVQAFKGIPFDPEEPVEVRFDTQRCRQYLRERERNLGVRVCGLCVYICPFGWSMKRKRNARKTTLPFLRQQLAGVVTSSVPGEGGSDR